MALISNTFNAIDSQLFGGFFRRTLNTSQRLQWRSYFSSSSTPIMVDMNDLIDVYQICPPLNIVINKKAEMLSNGILRLRKIDTHEDVEKHWALDLMKNPNALQSFKEYVYEFSIYSDIYANAFVYRNAAFTGRAPKALFNFPPALMKVIPTGKWYDQTELSGIVKEYEMYGLDGNIVKKFTTDEVKHINSGISKSPLISESKLIGLHTPISNIVGALKTRNLFIYYGPKQIVSSKSNDGTGAIPLGKTEKERVEKTFNSDYGINDRQTHTVVTNASLTVEKMSYPTKDMMLFEEMEEDFGWICGAFGMDRDIFPSTKGATNENKKQGEQATYQSTIAPTANSFCNFLDTLLNLNEEGIETYMDYSHLPIMQEDKQKAATEKKVCAEAYSILFHDGIISADQFAELMEVEMDGSGEIFEKPKTDAPKK